MEPVTSSSRPTGIRTAPFATVVCGVDGSATSLEASRQAAALCVPDGALLLVSVTWEREVGPHEQAAVSRWRADRALSEARTIALDLGLEPRVTEVSAEDPATALIELASPGGLIVLGVHGRSRSGEDPVGRTAAALLNRSPVPVLVARPARGGAFGESVLLAVDGTPSCLGAADIAGRVAASLGGRASIVSAPGHDEPTREILAEAARRLRAATGVQPLILDESGAVHRAVAAAATSIGASLILTGSRGLTGAQALHSVSERIARTAPCSVLVARGV
jgi:nucleotide-binding universal stress UspA family protein